MCILFGSCFYQPQAKTLWAIGWLKITFDDWNQKQMILLGVGFFNFQLEVVLNCEEMMVEAA